MKAFLKIFFMLLPVVTLGQTNIYRSVQAGNTSAIAVGSGNNLRVSNDTCYFASALPDTVGIGCALQYDDDNDGDIDANDSILFFKKRVSSTVFLGQAAAGGAPTATAAVDQDWSIFHAYTTMGTFNVTGVNGADENTGIDGDLRNFDTSADRNIDSASEIFNVVCYTGIDSILSAASSTGFDGWDTSVTEYINIFTPVTSDQVGISQYQRYELVMTGAGFRGNDDAGTRVCAHLRMNGIKIKMSGTGAQNAIDIHNDNHDADFDIRISNCIIRGTNGTSTQASHVGIYTSAVNSPGGGSYKIWNNFIYDFKNSGASGAAIGRNSGSGQTFAVYAYNNTVVNSNIGIIRQAGVTYVLINNLVQDCTDAFSGSFNTGTDYNCADIADNPGAGSNNRESKEAIFIDAAGKNFHLAANDTAAKDFGTDLSGDSNLAFSTDIDNQTRSGTWDIGGDEQQISSIPSRRRVIIIGGLGKYLTLLLAFVLAGCWWRIKT